jgi:hypothetical protein
MRVVAELGITLLILPPRAFPQSVVKLWSVDLSQDQDFRMRSNAPEIVLRRPLLDFLNEDQIIVAFDDSAMSTLTARTTIPFGFHVLEVGVGSGNLGRKLLFKVIVDTSQAEVKVFDWNPMKQIGKISYDMPEQPENSVSSGFKESAIALSPNGHHLVVLTGSVLDLYKLR